ncbi:peptidoglycan-binding domain-containing protein [Nonomuraea sp. NPDC004702]
MDDFRTTVARLIKADHAVRAGRSGSSVTRRSTVGRTRLAAGCRTLGFELDIDGAYGSASRAVRRKIQRDAGLDDDGIVGRLTWAATLHAR